MESIDGNASASTEAKIFYAKEEAKHGLAKEIESKHIPDLRVVSGNGEALLYARDQSDIPQLLKDILLNYRPDVVVQPSTPEAVWQALQFAGEHSLTVIPRGAASSPFGGAVPVDGGMVLDLSTMDRILEIDVKGQKVIVQAGARWADVDHALNEKGLRLITSPSSKFSTVGGWVAVADGSGVPGVGVELAMMVGAQVAIGRGAGSVLQAVTARTVRDATSAEPRRRDAGFIMFDIPKVDG